MIIFPHPDDETMAAGGLLISARKAGWKTIVVVLTAGEAGKININPRGRSTREVRLAELKTATKMLGVTELITADFGDAKLKGQEKELSNYLTRLLNEYQPGLVVTYDHSGLTGHPDHITVSLVVKKIFKTYTAGKKNNNNRPRLFWSTLPDRISRLWQLEISDTRVLPNYRLVTGLADMLRHYRAARSYRSQVFIKGPYLPMVLLMLLFRAEWYYEVDLTKEYRYKYIDFEI